MPSAPSRLALAFLTVSLSPFAASLPAQTPAPAASLVIDAGAPAAKASPLLYGLMTEEINYCYDGGLYAELVRNRVFKDDPHTPVHWSVVQSEGTAASIALDHTAPLNDTLDTSLRLDVTATPDGHRAGVANTGYWGIPVKPATRYRAFFYARATVPGPVTVSIESDDGATRYALAQVSGLTSDWHAYSLTLTTAQNAVPTTKARIVLSVDHPGTVWFNLVSLFPPTWNDRPNGLRPDLMQMLVDLKPAFLRLPGGNYLEGDTVETRFDWKKTLGPVTARAGHPGPWGYRSTDGMGLLEFLLWCEDMRAEPVLGLYAGYSLKGAHITPGPDLAPYVQDALDEIEYVTGPATSKWGAVRARDGHPAPFKLRYVEIGNEDWFDRSGSYDGRFTQFFDAIKAKYPNLKCISSVGTEQPAGKRIRTRRPDVLDEHYYRKADDFIKDSPAHFDHYDRKGPEIFVGEWASHETAYPPWDKRAKNAPPTPTMKAALGDAAWMAAMERNADLITMQCYAPLFVNVNEYQWRPDLIGYDALHAYGSPSYYALRMFSTHYGDEILKAVFSPAADVQATVTRDSRTGAIYLKLVNPAADARPLAIDLRGLRSLAPVAAVQTLAAAPDATNSLAAPTNVVPVDSRLTDVKPAFTYTVPAHSITVITLNPR